MLSRRYVEDALREGGYLLIFEEAVRRAMQSWRDVIAGSPENMSGANPRERANFLNRRIIELICEALENDPFVVITPSNQTKIITVKDEITLRFKKLNRKLRPINTKTHRVKLLWHQNARPLPGDFQQWINLTFGWQLSRTGSLIQLAVVNELGDRLEWFIPVANERIEEVLSSQMSLFGTEVTEPEVYTAKPRDTERARRIAEAKSQNTDEAKS